AAGGHVRDIARHRPRFPSALPVRVEREVPVRPGSGVAGATRRGGRRARPDGAQGRALMKRIDVLAVGGTISSVPKAGDSGVEPTLGAEAILGDRVGRPDLNLVFHDLPPLPSNWLSLEDAARIAARIDEVGADGSEGVLVIQGTDTLDEVPFAV